MSQTVNQIVSQTMSQMRPMLPLLFALGLAAAFLPVVTAAAPAAPAGGTGAAGPAPDYAAWNDLLARNYDPARGMNYKDLKGKDGKALADLRQRMATVDVSGLAPPDQLAYWINLYNISVVSTVVDHYPVNSIRDISTDPITRLNVFKKETVAVKGGKLSLNDIENQKIRAGFKDPRIHFAINCAASSCPPIRPEAFTGPRLGEQLDDQARRFLNEPNRGVKIDSRDGSVVIHVTKVMDWFGDDFKNWAGGQVAFIRKYLPPEKQKLIDAAKGNVKLDFYPYDWKLNDTSAR
ncbi:MAG TPA: DUF547 domain-containing protein [Thermoanaerobaculia bacterium]|nr:DUF547 domain-containing protein [Thermoanaerobaculia bacterium]